MPYIDLSRRFHDLPKEELASPEVLAYWSDHDSVSMGWDELLKHPRVILLAEAGSGASPALGRGSPSRSWTAVVLPAPLGPSRTDHLAGPHLEIDAVQGCDRALPPG